MKYAVAILLPLVATLAAAQPPQRVPDLRQVLQQYDAASAPQPQPRQLTPVERAALRKQLADFTPPPRPRKQ